MMCWMLIVMRSAIRDAEERGVRSLCCRADVCSRVLCIHIIAVVQSPIWASNGDNHRLQPHLSEVSASVLRNERCSTAFAKLVYHERLFAVRHSNASRCHTGSVLPTCLRFDTFFICLCQLRRMLLSVTNIRVDCGSRMSPACQSFNKPLKYVHFL